MLDSSQVMWRRESHRLKETGKRKWGKDDRKKGLNSKGVCDKGKMDGGNVTGEKRNLKKEKQMWKGKVLKRRRRRRIDI